MLSRMRVLVLLCALLAAGCGGPKLVKDDQLPRLVLQPADLPRAFTRFDEGRQVRLDRVPGPRADPARFGREDGWKARFNRAGTAATRGPLVVESRVDLFGDAGGAKQDLAAYAGQFRRTASGARPVAVRGLGSEATALVQQRPGPPAARFVTVAWRDGNVTASVTANGFAAGLELADAVALARAQQRRIAAALGD
jgi:hypothetical protein